ncbi:hypothetical protein EP47_12740 [Legionella norrlandica]|uniref:Uncharacterized protein n=1 Tax=Legionella norrlandica TaxID=1498499 RepID=A0A0A2SNB2_9GAMM|nr:hypothetical protein [Legionella norrlandica]KGP62232.1 hypothetical protein EP47_12740 [Legionella norrlandica]
MSRLFKKHAVKNDNNLLKAFLEFDKNFKKRFQEQNNQQEDTNTNCCIKLFDCLKNTSEKIPQEYKDIAVWLTKLGTAQSKGEFNQKVLVSALHASLVYVSLDTTGSEIPANVLKGLIEEIAKQFGLDLEVDPDYPALQSYCHENNIDIPKAIQNIINSNQLAKVV